MDVLQGTEMIFNGYSCQFDSWIGEKSEHEMWTIKLAQSLWAEHWLYSLIHIMNSFSTESKINL